MVKRLTLKDQLTREEYLQRVARYTNADARRLGYPSADVLRLEIKLGELAGAWRTTKAPHLVHEYSSLLYRMILNGYDVNMLAVQDQLPQELMPVLPPEAVQTAIKQVYHEE